MHALNNCETVSNFTISSCQLISTNTTQPQTVGNSATLNTTQLFPIYVIISET